MNTDIASMLAQMDNEVIYKGYTRKQLSDAFSAVENKNDWKAEIYATMPGECVGIAVAAIEFFTATTPTVQLDVRTMTYHVSSIGYRRGPAGDH